MSESMQKKVGRVRRPRVQITYDVETYGALKQEELPFVVGVLAELGGNTRPKERMGSDKRKFVDIHGGNFNSVMADINPTLNLRVENKLADDGSEMAVQLAFRKMDDFDPGQIAEQVPALREMLKIRKQLVEALTSMDLRPEVEDKLKEILGDSAKVNQLAKELGITGEGS